MAVRKLLLLALAGLLISACGVVQSEAVTKMVLLGPFEGQYREIGYNALYAVRLGLIDSGAQRIELIAVDDGGSISSAVDRITGLAKDPAVAAILVIGPYATAQQAQQASQDRPMLIIGYWGTEPTQDNIYLLASRELVQQIDDKQYTLPADANAAGPIISGELFALEQVAKLRDSLDDITIISSASLPDETFRQRYHGNNAFAPEPGLLATLAYDAAQFTVQTLAESTSFTEIRYEGINGTISFVQNYWQDAPINLYRYNSEGQLVRSSEQFKTN